MYICTCIQCKYMLNNILITVTHSVHVACVTCRSGKLNGIQLTINGGIIIQSDSQKTNRVHIGYLSDKTEVTWLDYSFCDSASDCFSNQCCFASLVCLPSTWILCEGQQFVSDLTNTVVAGFKSFASLVGSTLEDLYNSAVQLRYIVIF